VNLIKRILPFTLAAVTVIMPACLAREYPVLQPYSVTEYRTEVTSEKYTDNRTSASSVSGEYELLPVFTWSSQEVYFGGVAFTWYYAYDIPPTPPHDDIRVRIAVRDQQQYERAVIRVLDMSKAGHIYAPNPLVTADESQEGNVTWQWFRGKSTITWLDDANTRIAQARFLAARTNLWSQSDNPVIEADAGKATRIAVIISGPVNRWNARIAMSVLWTLTTSQTQPVTGERQVTRQVPYTVQKQKTVYEVRMVPFWEVLFRP
jgi:hypothetical protein